ncbi:DUF4846 domain-containing protein [Clostridium grantii]|uniref:DUF4846 domain-containing protein n=1 Tax=Clostridium grantii DSM 8605 TaxID=1121316 RepID=A0A1M5VMP3_9CLOT|nr:DUF4846 domain-containing protein [Clostridium grantii]SHH76495.1 protein of unknown function (4846) [Clostridium grantii DSM 8605]
MARNKLIRSIFFIVGIVFLLTTSYICFKPKAHLSLKKQQPTFNVDNAIKINEEIDLINYEGNTIQDRFKVPEGYKRVSAYSNSFEEYLRNLTLKPHNSVVHYFDGKEKNKENVYIGVVDMEIGTRDLQQCADAIMRLRAEYLYENERYDEINFHFVNGFNCSYSKWRLGYRVNIDGNNTKWVKKYSLNNSYECFRTYLDIVFAYASTLSLDKELMSVDKNYMKIGDVFISGGSPGHAVIVVDMAINESTGEKLFIMAQSYMPAQDIQILVNNEDKAISPWYSTDFEEILLTPEWKFSEDHLKSF